MDEFIKPSVVSDMTGLTEPALAQRRYLGLAPKFYKPNARAVLYKRSEVVEWIESTQQTQTRRAVAS